MKRLIPILFVLILLVGCDMTSGKRWTEHRIIIAGALPAGGYLDSTHPIKIGKTVSANGGNLLDMITYDAEVYLKNITRADSVRLTFQSSDQQYLGFVDSNNALKIQFGETYRIDAYVDGNHAYAETTVPDSISFSIDPLGNATAAKGYSTSNTEPLPEIEFDTCNEQFPIELLFSNCNNFNMRYKYYCLENFSTNLEYTIVFAGIEHPDAEEADDWDPDMGGGLRENNWLARYQPILNENNRWSFYDDYYSSGFSFYGKYMLEIKIMDENYYKYLSYPEGYRFGGIKGGLGYFGSELSVRYYTNVVKQYSE